MRTQHRKSARIYLTVSRQSYRSDLLYTNKLHCILQDIESTGPAHKALLLLVTQIGNSIIVSDARNRVSKAEGLRNWTRVVASQLGRGYRCDYCGERKRLRRFMGS